MRQKSLLLIIAVAISALITCRPSPGEIQGLITRKDTGQPLTGATVVIESPAFMVTANDSGCFALLDLPPGDYDIAFSLPRFETVTVDGFEVRSGRSHKLDVTLQPADL